MLRYVRRYGEMERLRCPLDRSEFSLSETHVLPWSEPSEHSERSGSRSFNPRRTCIICHEDFTRRRKRERVVVHHHTNDDGVVVPHVVCRACVRRMQAQRLRDAREPDLYELDTSRCHRNVSLVCISILLFLAFIPIVMIPTVFTSKEHIAVIMRHLVTPMGSFVVLFCAMSSLIGAVMGFSDMYRRGWRVTRASCRIYVVHDLLRCACGAEEPCCSAQRTCARARFRFSLFLQHMLRLAARFCRCCQPCCCRCCRGRQRRRRVTAEDASEVTPPTADDDEFLDSRGATMTSDADDPAPDLDERDLTCTPSLASSGSGESTGAHSRSSTGGASGWSSRGAYSGGSAFRAYEYW
jgi:hypothetical protein